MKKFVSFLFMISQTALAMNNSSQIAPYLEQAGFSNSFFKDISDCKIFLQGVKTKKYLGKNGEKSKICVKVNDYLVSGVFPAISIRLAESGEFLSSDGEYRNHCQDWETYIALVKNKENYYSDKVSFICLSPEEKFGAKLTVDEDDQWIIELAEPAVISVKQLQYNCTSIRNLDTPFESLPSSSQDMILRMMRSHKETGFFYLTDHLVGMKLFDFFGREPELQYRDDSQVDENTSEDGQFKKQSGIMRGDVKDTWFLNEYPRELSNDDIQHYFDHCSRLAEDVLYMLARGQAAVTKTSPEWISKIFNDNERERYSKVLMYYPGPNTTHTGSTRVVTNMHNDSSYVTLLIQDGLGGLELKKNETWIPVPPHAGAIIANTGNLLRVISEGYFPAVCHRVVRNNDTCKQTRRSLAFFYGSKHGNMGDC